jgi:hypothetical protein
MLFLAATSDVPRTADERQRRRHADASVDRP